MSLFSRIRSLNLNEEDSLLVARSVVAYLIGADTAFDMQRNVKPVLAKSDTGKSAKVFRLELLEDSQIILDVKFAALNLCYRTPSVETLRDVQADFNIDRNDMVLLKRCFTNRRWRSKIKQSPRVKAVQLRDVTVDNKDRLLEALADISKALMPTIRNVVYKKMRFLANSENMELADFHNELMCKAILAYYMMVPTVRTDAHVINSLRVACTNHALNIINAKTSHKRRRMDNMGSDGFGGYSFSLRTVSENQMMVTVDGIVEQYDGTMNDANSGHAERLLSTLSYERLLQRMGRTTVRENILSILSGTECPRFTTYLQECSVIREHEDCVDFVERNSFATIVKRMSTYFKVDADRLTRFLTYVGKELKKGRSA